MENSEISLYKRKEDKIADITTIEAELQLIKSGKYRDLILQCRTNYKDGNITEYGKLKSSLPAVTYSALFDKARTLENIKAYTNHIIIDIDKITDDPESIKEILKQDPYIYACWISPSGKGLKILIRTKSTIDNHKIYFNSLVNYFNDTHNINIDKTGSDINRLCFSSWDENLYINGTSRLYKIDIVEPIKEPSEKAVKDKTIGIKPILKSERGILFATEGKNKTNHKEMIVFIISYLTKKNKSITNDYDKWYRVAIAIANSFSYDIGEKFFLKLCILDGSDHSEYKSIEILKYAYLNKRDNEIKMGTIIHYAKQQGFIVKKSARKHVRK